MNAVKSKTAPTAPTVLSARTAQAAILEEHTAPGPGVSLNTGFDTKCRRSETTAAPRSSPS
jgi:hypothetical protein